MSFILSRKSSSLPQLSYILRTHDVVRGKKQMRLDCMVFRNPFANNSRLGWIAAVRLLVISLFSHRSFSGSLEFAWDFWKSRTLLKKSVCLRALALQWKQQRSQWLSVVFLNTIQTLQRNQRVQRWFYMHV